MLKRDIFIIFLYTLCCLFYFLLLVLSTKENEILSRQKRFLLWKNGTGKVQVITGVGVPVDLQLETVIVGIVFKANYKVPSNISVYKHPGTFYERKKRSLSRWEIYRILADVTQVRGFGGKSCILRAICEHAYTPLDKAYGIFEEILHMIFTPTTTKEELSHYGDNEYFAAQKHGTLKRKCDYLFSDCKVSLMDIFTVH